MAKPRLKHDVKRSKVVNSSKKVVKKRWKKGYSSSSNPQTKTFRSAAKQTFYGHRESSGAGLTTEALEKHDALTSDDFKMAEDDRLTIGSSLGQQTFRTWATNWTECTNATFGRIHRYWASNSALHKECLAVLAAVTEVIKDHGGKETETEYFAALLTTLETVDEDQSVAAVLYLLSLSIKRVPVAVLQNRFSDTTKRLTEVLLKYVDTSVPSLLRSVISCLACLLRVQEAAVWSNPSTLQVFQGLLTFIVHTKPKVRKAAQQAVCIILKGSTTVPAGEVHPAAVHTAKFCCQEIQNAGGGATSSLHVLGLLKHILAILPQQSLKSTCEAILRVMTLSSVIVRSVGMKTIHGMFLGCPSSNSLPPQLNAQIISALYDYQPSTSDSQLLPAWLSVMEQAHVNLARLDQNLCVKHLPRLVSTIMKVLLSDQKEVTTTAASSLISLVEDCLGGSQHSDTVEKVVQMVQLGLGYQYHSVWSSVLDVITVVFRVLGKNYPVLMKKILKSLAELRMSHNFPYVIQVERAVGMAVKTMGPRLVLESIPLKITGDGDDLDFPVSWMFPVLRDNIQNTEIAFFTLYFFPLAAKLAKISSEFLEQKRTVESKAYDVLQQQIWGLLKGFCTCPTDLVQSFPGLAKVLGTALRDSPSLRMDVLAALRRLILDSMESENDQAVLAHFAKNYVPILLNIYTGDDEVDRSPVHLSVFETIKIYLQISPPELVHSVFDKCYEKMLEETNGTKKYMLLDLCIALIKYADKKQLKKVYPTVTEYLKTTDRTLQKKSYRVLEEICSGKSVSSSLFVTSHLEHLQTLLLQSLSSAKPSSKAPRLRCLISLFEQLKDENRDFLLAAIPEAIMCTKSIAERARLAAHRLLAVMVEAMFRWSDKDKSDCFAEFLSMMTCGLNAGDTDMVSATLLSLTRLLYLYKDYLTTPNLSLIVECTCQLLAVKSRDVIKTSLGLIKALIALCPDTSLAQFLSQIVSGLVGLKDEERHHFRVKNKDIFGRLIRKFGYDTIRSMCPQSLHKLLANIHKAQERAKRMKKGKEAKKAENVADDSDNESVEGVTEGIEELLRDTDSELDDDKESTPKIKKEKTGAAWLRENDDVVDFLDPSISQKVVAAQPSKGNKTKTNHGFKMASDGRLIIKEEEDSDEDETKKPLDNMEELIDAMSKHKKRKKRPIAGDEDDDQKYEAGGSGIHRKVKKEPKKSLDHGAEYKAKKAGGDIKKKGKPDPYAYVPLKFQNLNKRKRAKATGQFSNLVRGAKRGAIKGKKQKHKK